MTKAGIEIGGISMGTSRINDSQPNKRQTKDPFQALVMSNFSGDKANNKTLKPVLIDRDNFDEIMVKIHPELNLGIGAEHTVTLSFNTLEDFEPDVLFNKLGIFSELRALRRRLSNQSTFAEAAKEVCAWFEPETQSKQQESTSHSPQTQNNTAANEGNLLDALLSETSSRQQDSKSSSSDLAKNLIRDIVAPHIIPAADPKQAEYIQSIDNSVSELMSSILHHPQFQTLESAWRGLYFLVKRTMTDSSLKLFILDINKQDLAKLVDSDEEHSTLFYKNIVEPYSAVAGAKPWSIWFGDYFISDQADDIFFLERMGKLASESNITFISAAAPQLVACQGLAIQPDADDWQTPRDNNILNAWQYLRNSAQAKHLALTFPRFLLRLPYGAKTRSAENFDYEEMPEPKHNSYLWANAGYALVSLLAESYSENKWQFRPGQLNEISNLPVHVYVHDGDQELKPCAEILLTESAAEKITQHGIMPVWSVKESDKIRIGPMISFHTEPTVISGSWVQ